MKTPVPDNVRCGSCKTHAGSGQPFPTSNPRTIIVDERLPRTLRHAPGEVFSYKLTTLKKSGGKFVQDGCAPNYQGGRITLCTCMHYHRTWPRIDVGTWIAGFSDNAAGNELFYLMRVGSVCDSFHKLWHSGLIPSLPAKSTSCDIYGDLYEPRTAATAAAPYNPALYKMPVAGHKHLRGGAWMRDISFTHWSTGRSHKLLIGEPGNSIVWKHPLHAYK